MEQCRASSSLSSSFSIQQHSPTPRPHAQFTHTVTEPHHALTVDGEGEDSGGNEVHEIYVRLGAAPATALNEKDTLPCQNESKDTLSCKSFQLSKKTHFRARKERKTHFRARKERRHTFVLTSEKRHTFVFISRQNRAKRLGLGRQRQRQLDTLRDLYYATQQA